MTNAAKQMTFINAAAGQCREAMIINNLKKSKKSVQSEQNYINLFTLS
jgi:hypothetical protein